MNVGKVRLGACIPGELHLSLPKDFELVHIEFYDDFAQILAKNCGDIEVQNFLHFKKKSSDHIYWLDDATIFVANRFFKLNISPRLRGTKNYVFRIVEEHFHLREL